MGKDCSIPSSVHRLAPLQQRWHRGVTPPPPPPPPVAGGGPEPPARQAHTMSSKQGPTSTSPDIQRLWPKYHVLVVAERGYSNRRISVLQQLVTTYSDCIASFVGRGMHPEAGAAAAAAVRALQQPGVEQCSEVAHLLPGVSHCSISLILEGHAEVLHSGNLLRQTEGVQLVAGLSLARVCMKENKSKLLRLRDGHRCAAAAAAARRRCPPPSLDTYNLHRLRSRPTCGCSHVLEDVRSIVQESGCSAIACLPVSGRKLSRQTPSPACVWAHSPSGSPRPLPSPNRECQVQATTL